ncbi:MAG TPA: hypothetical protein ENN38_05790 [Actinobacteria bacterium]|nr:hypothetical protein [Actinomycetota bacterium]
MKDKTTEKSLSDLIVELVNIVSKYLRQESKETLESSVIKPLNHMKDRMIFGIIAAFLIGLSVIFVSVSVFLLLVKAVGSYWLGLGTVGIILLVGGFVLLRKAR